MLPISYSKRAFCWKTQSDLFPQKTFSPPSRGKKKSWSLVTVFPSEHAGFINGERVICGSEMWLCSPMWMSGSLDSFMRSQLDLPFPLCRRDTRLGPGSLTHGFFTGFYEPLPDNLYIHALYQRDQQYHGSYILQSYTHDTILLSYSHPYLRNHGLWSC